MDRFFITGGSGFIGSHFHREISSGNVINYDIQEPFFEYDSKFIQGDIRDTEKLTKHLEEDDILLHLAATHFDFQENYFPTNVKGTRSLLQAAREAGIKTMVFFSSVAVYGAVSKPTSVHDEPEPNMPYGASKLEAETLIKEWAGEDPDRRAIIIRPTVVYGPYNFGNVFNLIRQIDSGFFVNIGTGKTVKSIVYVKNLVSYTLQALEKAGPGVSLYNATDEPHLATDTLTSLIANKLGKKVPFTLPLPVAKGFALPFDLLKAVTGKDWVISKERIEKFCTDTHFTSEKLREAGVEQPVSSEEGLAETIDWYRSVDWEQLYKEWQQRVEKYN
ncbi:NAD-dependent epimerase/dehydratase family protein [Balneolaceae bacterium YR4-1]|uniref:NAD-dependent epimerase/dehydratase family protein n=1 Tax=Halalkalibaculum roseum TaxID=2709311 RepID=A0A6M1SLS1_9BACT|nr:NAD-dependent epimerase/dehydratase family protein [Halalkalibaculum roseum]NGP75949.1 NAD-dependent epimerase/dehydratase family protein [Halalkalibaculum roseum]